MSSTRLIAILLGLFLLSDTNSNADSVIAFWDFNNGFDESNGVPQIAHPATIGMGTLYQQRADTDGNGKGGTAFSDPTLGLTVIEGRAMAWDDMSKSGDNDAEFFIEISTVGYTNLTVSFDVRGNGDPADELSSYDVKVDTNSLQDVVDPGDVTGTIKDFTGGISTSVLNNQPIVVNGSTFVRESIDLSSLTQLNNQSTVAIRFDDFAGNDQVRFDNVLVTGITAVPEPSSASLLVLLASTATLRRRRTQD